MSGMARFSSRHHGDRNTADIGVRSFAVRGHGLFAVRGHGLGDGAGPMPRPIAVAWLVHTIAATNEVFRAAVDQLRPTMRDGDELSYSDEPAPPGVNAGEVGVALVREGVPVHAVMQGVD